MSHRRTAGTGITIVGLSDQMYRKEILKMPRKAKRVILVGIDGFQLCQIQRFVGEGVLPNFKRLLDSGSAGELLPELPAWTPTNWGTIATGALAGSTMLAGWTRYPRNDLEDEGISTFSNYACPVETIWETAERSGLKTLSIFYPLTWPPRVKQGMVVAPLYSGRGLVPLDISRGRIWTSRPERMKNALGIDVRRDGDRFIADVGITPSAIELAKDFNFGDKPEESGEKVALGRSVPIKLVFDPNHGEAGLFGSDGEKLCAVGQGKWSDWIILDFGARGKGTVRFYLFSCDESSEFGFTLLHSGVYPTSGFTYPEDLAEGIIENVGPFLSGTTAPTDAEWNAVWFEEYEYQGLWMARAARYLLERSGWDLYYQHYHIVDSASHAWLNHADPEGGGYNPAKADLYVGLMRKAYVIADKMLGIFMEMQDDETALIAISDHGNVPNKWVVDYSRVLEAAGLLSYNEDGIIWEKTRAFMIPQRITDIYINLKDKFPRGTVDPVDYEKIQEQIIDALLDLRNPDGKRVVAYALKKKDAHIVGYYGAEIGDVIFVFNSFHGRSHLPEGVSVVRAKGGANHGPQIATTRTGFSSDLATAIISGPGIRRGYVRDDEAQGLWKLTDIVPTIAHMLRFEAPKDSRGGIMYDLFE